MNEQKEPTNKEPIEGIKVWLLLLYSSNILGYPSKYWNYISKKKLGQFLHSPWPPQWITFLPFISQKILLNIKDVEFDFRMGVYTCLISVFINNKHAIYKFRIFEFSIFFSNIAILDYFDLKLPFLSLKFL